MKRRNLLLLPALALLYFSVGCFFRPIDDGGRHERGHEFEREHDRGHDHEHEH